MEIQVRPGYLSRQSRPDQHMFAWSYEVTITNHSTRRLQLLNRHWIITDGRGVIEEVQGAGVIGDQPIILPNAAFRYTSGCPLRTPTGNMRGWYDCVDLDTREKIKVRIPLFFLRSGGILH
ncbi:MAG: Co2+/Mg2+ efflux protein ApaG [Proteobacteria bacterium]|nr:Co2+/Mg2+ efflux protein ApaG [Pseudomonadota bacterium]